MKLLPSVVLTKPSWLVLMNELVLCCWVGVPWVGLHTWWESRSNYSKNILSKSSIPLSKEKLSFQAFLEVIVGQQDIASSMCRNWEHWHGPHVWTHNLAQNRYMISPLPWGSNVCIQLNCASKSFRLGHT